MAKLDYTDPDFLTRLQTAVKWSNQKMDPFRKQRKLLIQQYVGTRYGEKNAGELEGTMEKVPVNFIELIVNITSRHLIAQNPRVMVTTPHLDYKMRAARLELAINHLLPKIDFADELQQAVVEAILWMGILKVGLMDDGYAGIPYARNVDPDDFFVDLRATRWNEIAYVGDRYVVPLDWAKDNRTFTAKSRELLVADQSDAIDENGNERAKSLSVGTDSPPSEIFETVTLMDVYLPRERCILTLPCGQYERKDLLLNVVEDVQRDPYRRLTFNTVPGNLLPASPLHQSVYDMHTLANELYRKVARQASRQKTIGVVSGATDNEGDTVRNAADGEIVELSGRGSVNEQTFGGMDAKTLAMFIQNKDLINWVSGNLDVLGGLGAASDTVGQERIMASNASSRIKDMQGRVAKFVQNVVGDLAWYLWTDPVTEFKLLVKVPGRQDIPVSFTPEDRQGDLSDYDVQIDPYSMQYRSPGELAQIAVQMWEMILKSYPLLQQQGQIPDVKAFLTKLAHLYRFDGLEEFIKASQRQPEAQQAQQQQGMPAQTTRTYERVNKPGATRGGKDDVMARVLMGAGVQGSEAAAMNRSA